jgi:glycosyltransferase involved in cell wall biosynthesis
MRASVVVPTLNRRSMLVGCLQSLDEQTMSHRDYEIIVANNGSLDGTREWLDSWSAVRPDRRIVVDEPRAGVSRARNKGIRAARGEYVLFLDDDALAPRGWVAAHVAAYRGGNVVAVGGPIVLVWPDGRPGWLAPRLEHWFSALDLGDEPGPFPRPHGPYGMNMSVRRRDLVSVGGFTADLGRRGTNLISSEEPDLSGRLWAAGGDIAYEPATLVMHRVLSTRLSRRWVLRRGWAQGRSNARLRRRENPLSRRELRDVCRNEATMAMQGLPDLVRLAARRDQAGVVDEVARRAGHASCVLEHLWLGVREPMPGRGSAAA